MRELPPGKMMLKLSGMNSHFTHALSMPGPAHHFDVRQVGFVARALARGFKMLPLLPAVSKLSMSTSAVL